MTVWDIIVKLCNDNTLVRVYIYGLNNIISIAGNWYEDKILDHRKKKVNTVIYNAIENIVTIKVTINE